MRILLVTSSGYVLLIYTLKVLRFGLLFLLSMKHSYTYVYCTVQRVPLYIIFTMTEGVIFCEPRTLTYMTKTVNIALY